MIAQPFGTMPAPRVPPFSGSPASTRNDSRRHARDRSKPRSPRRFVLGIGRGTGLDDEVLPDGVQELPCLRVIQAHDRNIVVPQLHADRVLHLVAEPMADVSMAHLGAGDQSVIRESSDPSAAGAPCQGFTVDEPACVTDPPFHEFSKQQCNRRALDDGPVFRHRSVKRADDPAVVGSSTLAQIARTPRSDVPLDKRL
jgi:hypothetical protein